MTARDTDSGFAVDALGVEPSKYVLIALEDPAPGITPVYSITAPAEQNPAETHGMIREVARQLGYNGGCGCGCA